MATPHEQSYLLNLLLPEAQDLFFAQFAEMIDKFNCTRIWFDYNTAARQSHWNLHEDADRQGLLELGFYQGLYAVFDRTRKAYPGVWIEGCASGGRMIDLGSLTRVQSYWINDDSESDVHNRRLRLGANHFIPAHYIQNAFLPIGCTDGPPHGAPIKIDPQRLLTYFNGVLQFGQGVAFWDEASLSLATAMVDVYKLNRHLMDPLASNYYRLFDAPDPNPVHIPHADTTKHVGWVYESTQARVGILYLMRQENCTMPTIAVPLTRGTEAGMWPWTRPAPRVVRVRGQTTGVGGFTPAHDNTPVHPLATAGSTEALSARAAVPTFRWLAGGAGNVQSTAVFAVKDRGGGVFVLEVVLPWPGTQALLGYSF